MVTWKKGKVRKVPVMEKEAKETKTQTGLINELLAGARAENERLREHCNTLKSVLAITLARLGEIRDMMGGDPEGVRVEAEKLIDEIKNALMDRKVGGES